MDEQLINELFTKCACVKFHPWNKRNTDYFVEPILEKHKEQKQTTICLGWCIARCTYKRGTVRDYLLINGKWDCEGGIFGEMRDKLKLFTTPVQAMEYLAQFISHNSVTNG